MVKRSPLDYARLQVNNVPPSGGGMILGVVRRVTTKNTFVSIDGCEPFPIQAQGQEYTSGDRVWVALDNNRRPSHIIGKIDIQEA